MRTGGGDFRPQRGWLENGDCDNSDQGKLKGRKGLWAALEPIERNCILISAGHDQRLRRTGNSRSPQVWVRNEHLSCVGFEKMNSILMPVEMEEGRRKDDRYEREQNLDREVTAH